MARRAKYTTAAALIVGFSIETRERSPARRAEDAAEGIVLAAERYDESEPVNLGSSFEMSIKGLTETVARASGFIGGIACDTSQPKGQPRRKLEASRARERFRLEAQMRVEAGLRGTVRWHEGHSSSPFRSACRWPFLERR